MAPRSNKSSLTPVSGQTIDGVDHCIAHAKAPGYETYTTGRHSVIAQKL